MFSPSTDSSAYRTHLPSQLSAAVVAAPELSRRLAGTGLRIAGASVALPFCMMARVALGAREFVTAEQVNPASSFSAEILCLLAGRAVASAQDSAEDARR